MSWFFYECRKYISLLVSSDDFKFSENFLVMRTSVNFLFASILKMIIEALLILRSSVIGVFSQKFLPL
jgi:hypothetical protein